MTYKMISAVPSSSHNAPYSPEAGNHWPAGSEFRLLEKGQQKWYRRNHGANNTFFEQIGGEKVVISIPTGRIAEFLIGGAQ